MQSTSFHSQRWENIGTQAIHHDQWSFHLYLSQCHLLHNLHSLQTCTLCMLNHTQPTIPRFAPTKGYRSKRQLSKHFTTRTVTWKKLWIRVIRRFFWSKRFILFMLKWQVEINERRREKLLRNLISSFRSNWNAHIIRSIKTFSWSLPSDLGNFKWFPNLLLQLSCKSLFTVSFPQFKRVLIKWVASIFQME